MMDHECNVYVTVQLNDAQASSTYRAALALERLAETCKEARLKLRCLKEGELLTPFPMLRPGGLTGLLQVGLVGCGCGNGWGWGWGGVWVWVRVRVWM